MDFLDQQCADTSIGVANPLIIHLVSSLLTNYCNTSPSESWPEDYGSTARQLGTDMYDFIVIGSGSAGAVVANRLSESPTQRVLLIEAGGDPPIESEIPGLANSLHGTKYDWMYSTRSNGNSCLAWNENNCVWGKGKILGGSSSVNGLLYARGNARDYNTWENLGNPSWGWETVTKFFKFSENFKGKDRYRAHGTGGPLNVEPFRAPRKDQQMILQASKELRYDQIEDFVEGNNLGFGYLYGTVQDGRRYSVAKGYLRVERENLHIIKNAVAKKINFNADKKATSVTFDIDGTFELTMNATKEIILSAGSIESPKLLMLSGIGPRNHLQRHGIPLIHAAPVGENLQDHTTVTLFLRLEEEKSTNESIILDGVYDHFIHQYGPLSIGVLNIGAFINSKRNADPFPDIQYIYQPIPSFDIYGARYKPNIRQSIRHQIGPKDRLIAVFVSLLNPNAKGRVRLASNNYKEKPFIQHNYLGDLRDLNALVRGIKRQLEFEDTNAFRKRNAKFLKVDLPACNNFTIYSDDYWACYARHMTTTVFHPVGTVKMGPATDPAAIVDHHLQVRGVEGLRVIDGSIMPNIVSANTNAPIIMIGEKGADYIKSLWNIVARKF